MRWTWMRFRSFSLDLEPLPPALREHLAFLDRMDRDAVEQPPFKMVWDWEASEAADEPVKKKVPNPAVADLRSHFKHCRDCYELETAGMVVYCYHDQRVHLTVAGELALKEAAYAGG